MSQSDVATGRGDVVRGRNRTIWRPAPFTVRAAGYLLFADASITIAAAVALAGPTVLSRLTGLEMLPGASAQAPMVWEVALPSVIGATLGLAFAALEVGCGLLLRRVLWWSRLVVSGLVVAAYGLALVPGPVGMAFHFSGWAGTLPGVKHALLAGALLLAWLPAASREFFRRPASQPTSEPTGSAPADPANPAGPADPAASADPAATADPADRSEDQRLPKPAAEPRSRPDGPQAEPPGATGTETSGTEAAGTGASRTGRQQPEDTESAAAMQ